MICKCKLRIDNTFFYGLFNRHLFIKVVTGHSFYFIPEFWMDFEELFPSVCDHICIRFGVHGAAHEVHDRVRVRDKGLLVHGWHHDRVRDHHRDYVRVD